MKDHSVRLEAGDMIVTFDRRFGWIRSITQRGCRFGTNYVGNLENIRGLDPMDSRWTGDIITTVFESHEVDPKFIWIGTDTATWRRELTGRSGDIRQVTFDGETFQVRYTGRSGNEHGIRSFDLTQSYRVASDKSLLNTSRWPTGRVSNGSTPALGDISG